METIKNFINGSFQEPVHGAYLDNINPSTGKKYGTIPDSDKEDVAEATRVATNAFLHGLPCRGKNDQKFY